MKSLMVTFTVRIKPPQAYRRGTKRKPLFMPSYMVRERKRLEVLLGETLNKAANLSSPSLEIRLLSKLLRIRLQHLQRKGQLRGWMVEGCMSAHRIKL